MELLNFLFYVAEGILRLGCLTIQWLIPCFKGCDSRGCCLLHKSVLQRWVRRWSYVTCICHCVLSDNSITAGVGRGAAEAKHCSAFMDCSETALTPAPHSSFQLYSEENLCAGVKQLPLRAH